MTERRIALGAIILTVLFWGFSFVSIKIAMEALPPMSLGAARFALAIVLLWFVKKKSCPDERLEVRDVPHLAGAGLVGVTAYFYFENNGVLLVSASEASIIIATIPVFTMVAERLLGGPRVAKRRWAGAALSVVGVWFVAGATIAVTGSAAGYLYMLGAAISWVGYAFLSRPIAARKSQVFIVFWQSVFGFVGFLPFTVAELPRWGQVSPAIVLHVAYLGVFCSAIGYWFYVKAINVLGVGQATIFVNLIPVVSVLASFLLLGERLGALQLLGGAVAVAGVYLATVSGARTRRR